MITVKNIYKKFGKHSVLNGISCEIKKGEKVVIIGPSGSGKSTFLRCLNLLETPTSGELWFEGNLITTIDPYEHPEVIKLSKTYKKLYEMLSASGEEDAEQMVIDQIIKNRALKKREGKEFNKALKAPVVSI